MRAALASSAGTGAAFRQRCVDCTDCSGSVQDNHVMWSRIAVASRISRSIDQQIAESKGVSWLKCDGTPRQFWSVISSTSMLIPTLNTQHETPLRFSGSSPVSQPSDAQVTPDENANKMGLRRLVAPTQVVHATCGVPAHRRHRSSAEWIAADKRSRAALTYKQREPVLLCFHSAALSTSTACTRAERAFRVIQLHQS